MDGTENVESVRLAEVLAALSLGIDLGFGQPMEHVLRQCRIALRISELLGLDEGARSSIYYSALLVNVGCHTDAYEQAHWFGDDIALKATKYGAEPFSVADMLAMLRLLGSGGTPLHRLRVGFDFAVSGRKQIDGMITHHAELARSLGEELGLGDDVLALTVDDVDLDADDRRYSLPAGHTDVLVNPESVAHVAPFAAMVVGVADALPDIVDAYRTGAGVPYTRYGTDFRDGQGAINRPAYHHDLAGWIAAMPDVDARLRATPPARIADLGCGQGWSTIALSRAYPDAEVIGIDSDIASIKDATERAHAAGVGVSFRTVDAGLLDGSVDLVCIFEALHDMAKPVEALAAAGRALTPGGAVLVVDERVADTFTAPGDEVERVMYGWSVLHCLPASRAETPSAALGTVLRAPIVRRLASEAGFGDVEILDIDHDFFRFYRLNP